MPKFDENYKATDPRSLTDLENKTGDENYAKEYPKPIARLPNTLPNKPSAC